MRTIEEMMARKPVKKDDPSNETNPEVINDFGICYFAPNTGILYQFRLHMAEHMIYNHYLDNYKEDK